jgi:hypothetical protein
MFFLIPLLVLVGAVGAGAAVEMSQPTPPASAHAPPPQAPSAVQRAMP